MHATLPLLEQTDFPAIRRGKLETVQINVGYRCNQQCLHCHVNASPNRKEMMSEETAQQLIKYLKHSGASTLDITGGAPELNPHFRTMVEAARAMNVHVIDRCNLTILNEPDQQDLADFLAAHQVEVVASMPCYLEENVDAQRGKGVYQSSIAGLQKLNALGYGKPDSQLQLNLVYNPQGAALPPPQESLEADYHKQLDERHGIKFNHLFTITNMPIQRFGSTLISTGEFEPYMQLIKDAYQQENLGQVMCRSLISIDWQGYAYDCDFNQMLGLPLRHGNESRIHISDLMGEELNGNAIAIADHCYGCTAGQGSSCGGAL